MTRLSVEFSVAVTQVLYIYNNLNTSQHRCCSVDIIFRYTINNAIISLLSSFWKNKRRLMRSPCCLCLCASVCVYPSLCVIHSYFVRRFMTSPYFLCVCEPSPPPQFLLFLCGPYRLKEAQEVTLLSACPCLPLMFSFSMQSLPYRRKLSD
jgi:hypothetical protein